MGNPMHKCHFTKTWFNKALNKLGCKNFAVESSNYSYYPHDFIPIIRVPAEIKVTIWRET
jgi:hypothetical protein